MGFHIIIVNKDNQPEQRYVETCEELVYISKFNKDSIIYEGEPHWKPVIAGDSDKYKNFTDDRFRAGIKAQDIFRKQACDLGFIVESINQGQGSFESYIAVADCSIKRGDFLIRNANNIEVDVKCRSFHRENGERHFKFKIDDFDRHLNMISLTKTPVIIAVYQRSGDDVKPNQLFMFDIETMQKVRDNLEKIACGDGHICFKIPLGKTKKGFRVIERYIGKTEKEK